MAETTRADREAAAKALCLDGASISIRRWLAGEWSSDGFMFGKHADRIAHAFAELHERHRREMVEAAAYRRIRAGLNMDAEGASPEEVIEEVRRCHVTARITPWTTTEDGDG